MEKMLYISSLSLSLLASVSFAQDVGNFEADLSTGQPAHSAVMPAQKSHRGDLGIVDYPEKISGEAAKADPEFAAAEASAKHETEFTGEVNAKVTPAAESGPLSGGRIFY